MTEVQFAKQFLTTLDSKNTKYQGDHVFDPHTFQMRIPYTLPKLSHPPHPVPPKTTPTAAPAPGSERAGQTPAQTTTTTTTDLTLKSTRNPTFTLHLPNLPLSTPISTLRSQIQSLLAGSVATEKIKILHNKKPVPPSKATIHDVVTTASSEPAPSSVEFGVMVIGGATDPTPTEQTVKLNNETDAAGPGSENAAAEAITGVNPESALKSPPLPAAAAGAGSVDVVMEGADTTEHKQSEPVQPGTQSGHELLSKKEFWDDLQGFLEQRLRDTDEAGRLRTLFEKAAR